MSTATLGALDKAVQGALAWDEHGPADVEEAWAELWLGFQVARRSKEILGSNSEKAMKAVLNFLVSHGSKRRVLRKRVGECLFFLLSIAEWLSTAAACPGIITSLQNLLEDEKMVLVSAALRGEPLAISQEEEPADFVAKLQTAELDLQEVHKQFVEGLNIIKEFNWSFPPADSLTAVSDTAIEGFKKLQRAITGLSIIKNRKTTQARGQLCPTRFLNDFDCAWPNLCQFLYQMRYQAHRKTFTGQVDYVVGKLSEFSPCFATAASKLFPVDHTKATMSVSGSKSDQGAIETFPADEASQSWDSSSPAGYKRKID